MRASKLLPSLGHAASGAGATIISTLAIYPLDLVNTRLKVQRQLRSDGTISDSDAYKGILDAFSAIYANEGGIPAFFAGLGADIAKSAADSFLFFLFYTWFRARRLHAKEGARYLNALEELAVGAAAGACAKAFTTPVGNVVTRRQTARLLGSGRDKNGRVEEKSFGETVDEIRQERGILGLWAGYSASLVLTLNPSMTFFLQQMLKRVLVAREKWDEPGGQTTFLLAALSKVAATSLTYPFQIAKARVQVSAPLEEKRRIARDTIFATVFRIAKTEGVKALYDGIGGELLKGFFTHGTTMLLKDIIHGFLVKFYLAMFILLQRYPRLRARFLEKVRRAKEGLGRRYQRVSSNATVAGIRGALIVKETIGSGEKALRSLLTSSPKSVE